MDTTVSLIISFYNKIDLLEFILVALERQTYKNFEVIIADDGSKNEVVNRINILKEKFSFPIKHVWHEDKGWQKNVILNKAIIESTGEYLVFIDGDCIPHPKFIQEHVENRNENEVVSGRRVMLTEKVSESLTIDKIRNGYLDFKVLFPLLKETFLNHKVTYIENMIRVRNKLLRRLFIRNKIRGFWGCNFSIYRKNILKVNGFDERFVHPGIGEDGDLEDRLRRIGILSISKKHLVTQYHLFHIHFETMHKPNLELREENNKNKVTYTPYGIKKEL